MTKENCFLMYGEDAFTLLQEVGRWREAFKQKYGGDMNLEEVDGDKVNLAELGSILGSLPFLAEKRLVILKNFMSTSKADRQKELLETLSNMAETTVLVLVETQAPDKRTSLFKKLSKEATVKLFAKPKGAQLNNWLIRQAHRYEGQIDHRSAGYLANLVGDDLFHLNNEIHKLCLYAEGKTITIEMIDELVNSGVEQSIFTLTDQLAKKDMKGALKTLKHLEEQGQEPPYLFAMISRQFRLMLEIKALSEEGMSPSMIASKMKAHPYVVQTTQKQCRNFTYTQLKRGLEKLLDIDRRLKSGRLHLRTREADHYLLALEQVLVKS